MHSDGRCKIQRAFPFYGVRSAAENAPAIWLVSPTDNTSRANDNRPLPLQENIENGATRSSTSKEKQRHSFLSWKEVEVLPVGLYKGTVASHGDCVYCSSLGCNQVYRYSLPDNQWSRLPDCPVAAFALVVVKDSLTAVGGEELGLGRRPTNALHSLEEPAKRQQTASSSWTTRYPPMPSKRSYCTAVFYQDMLVVAGGQTNYLHSHHCLTTVEVMNTQTLLWFVASPLPWPLRSPSSALCDSDLYLLGGWDDSHCAVVKGDLNDLRKSCKTLSEAFKSENRLAPHQIGVWEPLERAPTNSSSCATLHGCLVLFGGKGERGQATDTVYVYTTAGGGRESLGKKTPQWKEVGRLPGGPLYHSLCVSVSGGEEEGNRAVVVGGLIRGAQPCRKVWTVQLSEKFLSSLSEEGERDLQRGRDSQLPPDLDLSPVCEEGKRAIVFS